MDTEIPCDSFESDDSYSTLREGTINNQPSDFEENGEMGDVEPDYEMRKFHKYFLAIHLSPLLAGVYSGVSEEPDLAITLAPTAATTTLTATYRGLTSLLEETTVNTFSILLGKNPLLGTSTRQPSYEIIENALDGAVRGVAYGLATTGLGRAAYEVANSLSDLL